MVDFHAVETIPVLTLVIPDHLPLLRLDKFPRLYLLCDVLFKEGVKPAFGPGLDFPELEILLLVFEAPELCELDVSEYREEQSLSDPIMCAPTQFLVFWHVKRGRETDALLVQEAS